MHVLDARYLGTLEEVRSSAPLGGAALARLPARGVDVREGGVRGADSAHVAARLHVAPTFSLFSIHVLVGACGGRPQRCLRNGGDFLGFPRQRAQTPPEGGGDLK